MGVGIYIEPRRYHYVLALQRQPNRTRTINGSLAKMNRTLKLMTFGMGVGAALTLTAAAEDKAASPAAAPAAPVAVEAEAAAGHVHTTAPAMKGGPRMEAAMSGSSEGMPPAFLQMQELRNNIKAKEAALMDKDPSIKEQLKVVEAEVKAFQAEVRARQAALQAKRNSVLADKDPELKDLYAKLAALREQLRPSMTPMGGMKRAPAGATPVAPPPPPAPAK
jgi:hypothetical protein